MQLHRKLISIIGILMSLNLSSEQPIQNAIRDKNITSETIDENHELSRDELDNQRIDFNNNQDNHEPYLISFRYNSEDLVDVINQFAALKHINILFPSGEHTLKAKVTIAIDDKLTVDQAWEVIITLLDISGYSIIQKSNMYTIVPTNKDITKEPLPLYISTPFEELPDSDERIRYLHYLTNVSAVPDSNNELLSILKELLPADASFQVDPNANAVIIADKASNVKSAINIINTIDQSEYQEKPQIIQLRHVSSDVVARLFRENILRQEQRGPRPITVPTNQSAATYFPEHIKIMPYARTNSLIILGKKQAVERVKHFIFKYLDIPLASGKSVLHIYSLQYLDAEKFAPILTSIVTASKSGGTGQSQGATKTGITERFFSEVIIQADKVGEKESGGKYGGNKLVIACNSQDWKRIRTLIEQLDTPQPQVIIEVLIADLSLEDTRLLGSLTRNPMAVPLLGNMSAQSAQLQGVVLDSPPNATVASDLLRQAFNNDTVSVAGLATPGSTIISLNDSDGRTWSIFQLLNLFNHRKVLSHPHIIATDHHRSEIIIGEVRIVPDEGTTSGNQATRKNKPIEAKLEISITPHISSHHTVTLDIEININEFTNNNPQSGNANQITRKVITNATVKNKAILALGGLTRIDTQRNRGITPLLGEIPIIGWFFKQRSNNLSKTTLTVFIQPTIVLPRLRGGVGEYTNQQLNLIGNYTMNGVLFENLRDPITRWYFAPDEDATQNMVNKFVAKDEFKQEAEFVDYSQSEVIVPRHGYTERLPQEEATTEFPVAENDIVPVINPRAEELRKLVNGKPNPLLVQSQIQ